MISVAQSYDCLFQTRYVKGIISVGIIYALYKSGTIQKFMRNFFLKVGLYKPRIISSSSEINDGVETLKRKLNGKQFLGLDCEWVSTGTRRHPVALLQLAAPDGSCSLFRLSALKAIPPELKQLLEDMDILKVGVAVHTDARYLFADYGVKCSSYLDLRHLAVEVGVMPGGLARLAYDLFGTTLDKNWRVRCSDWEAETLSEKQIEYAASDARIAVDIFNELNHRALCKHHSFWERIFWTERDVWRNTWRMWAPCIGYNFNIKSGSSEWEGRGGVSNRRIKPEVDQKIKKRHYSMLKQQNHYSNIFLLAPDHQVLSTISRNRADWYIENELADVISNDPMRLRLRFEPSKRSKDSDNYYTKRKENQCVVCGKSEELMRKNIVPLEYRKYFEESLKNHNSHDVLLLCFLCHNRCNYHDLVLRDRLVIECGAPLAEGDNRKLQEIRHLKVLRSAARALFFHGDVLPAKRKEELQQLLIEKLQVTPAQLNELLQNLIDIECVVENTAYKPHGQTVVQHYKTEGGGIEALERRWRQHFVDTMQPSHLPDLWSINYVRD